MRIRASVKCCPKAELAKLNLKSQIVQKMIKKFAKGK